MEYHEAANVLFDLRRFRMNPGTAATESLLAHLEDPQVGPEYVQIAGSNGKGSTARMVESVLRADGLDVGLYTSPHIDDVRDRIRVNDRPIPKSELVAYVEAIEDYVTDRAADGASPTFFEVLTGMALWHFGREDVDVGVLEVGIGGRYDATGAVDPAASAVTGVSLEHTGILGETVEEIARDKAQVAPRGAPLVTAATGDALAAIRDATGDLILVESAGDGGDGGDGGEGPTEPAVTVDYGGVIEGREGAVAIEGPDWGVETSLGMLGAHQARNAGVAAVLARQVADAGEVAIERGLRTAHWPGRYEVMERDPLAVLDGAHNPEACGAVAETLGEFDYDELVVVFGAMHDKDHAGMVEALPAPDLAVACRPDLDRSEDPAVLARVFERRGVPVGTERAVESAVERALDEAGADDCVLVTGSLYTVGEARIRWTRPAIPKRPRDLEDARRLLERAHVTAPGTRRMRAKAVHRVLKTRVRPRQAQFLKEELLSLGGECALSGLNDQDEERLDVVMMGTLAQFGRLVEKLDAQPYGLPEVAEDVREALDIRREPDRRGYPWEGRTAVMGILNVTPDSFHDGGRYEAVDAAVARAEEMAAAGADIVDVGGESTRPGADPVTVDEERDRVLPVIDRLADLDALVSVDTRRAAVAEAALDAGADILNDVSGLEDPDMRFLAADRDVPLVVMHSIDTPVVPDKSVHYDDVVEDVLREVRERVLLAERAGLDREQIVIDPGLGFGKDAPENFELLGRVHELGRLGCPVMVGHSHKSMFGAIGRYPDEGGHATVAATALAADRGVDIVRVHDVAANAAAIRAVEAATDPDDVR